MWIQVCKAVLEGGDTYSNMWSSSVPDTVSKISCGCSYVRYTYFENGLPRNEELVPSKWIYSRGGKKRKKKLMQISTDIRAGGIFSHKRKKFFCGNTPLGSDVHIAVLSRRNFLWKDGVKEGQSFLKSFQITVTVRCFFKCLFSIPWQYFNRIEILALVRRLRSSPWVLSLWIY